LPDDLQSLFVGETGLEWSFSPSEQRYYSFRAGVLNSRIRGLSLPDPNQLFIDRCNNAGIDRNSPEAAVYKPTFDTNQLWEDWNRRQ
jgi:hypothetical protein